MRNYKESTLENYLFDINIVDELYISLDKTKIQHNGNNYKQFTVDAIDIENSVYAIAVYSIGTKTVLTFLENGVTPISQFLIKSKDIRDYIKFEDVTPYVSYEVAQLVIGLFD